MLFQVGVGPAEPPTADPLVPVQRAMLAAAVMQSDFDHGEFDAAAIHGNDARAEKSTSICHGGTRRSKRITHRFYPEK